MEPEGRIQLDLQVKADEKVYDIINRFMEKNVNKEFLDRLFREDNFHSISGGGRIRAVYSKTSLTYVPFHLVGAFKLTNPSLPEIHVAGVQQSTVRLSQTFVFKKWPGAVYGELFAAPSIYYFKRNFVFADLDLLTASVQKVDDLIEKKKDQGVDGDVAMAIFSKRWYLPYFSLRIENVSKQQPCETCKKRFFDIERYFFARTIVGTGFTIPHPIGESALGAALPFWGTFSEFDKYQTALMYSYSISKLSSFVSASPLMTSFGFIFGADHYRVGIQYTDEKQDNSIQIKRQKHAYVFASYYF